MRRPGLKRMVQAAHDPGRELAGLGRRRAVIQCRHQAGWVTIGEVRADVVVAGGLRHDLIRSSYDIWVTCGRCPGSSGAWVLDLVRVREALGAPHAGQLKLDVADVSREPRDQD